MSVCFGVSVRMRNSLEQHRPTNDDTLKWFDNLQIVNIIRHEDQKVNWFVVFGMSFLKPGLVSIECFLEHFFQTLFT